MSSYRARIAALSGPLQLAERAPEPFERAAAAREPLLAALQAAARMRIPKSAQIRFAEAAGWIESEPWTAALAGRIARRLAPLVDVEYPQKVLSQPPERVPGIGPKLTAQLQRREIASVEDLLFLLPRVYEDRRELLPIEKLRVGQVVCFEARVVRSAVVPQRAGRRFLLAIVGDETASVQLKWFRGIAHFAERLQPGARVLVSGQVRRYRYALELHHPDLEFLGEETPTGSLARIVPVYPQVEGVPPRSLRRMVEAALDYAGDLVDGFVPDGVVRSLALPEVADSLEQVHRPGVHLDPEGLRTRSTPYHVRLVAEELFLLQVGLALCRSATQRKRTRPLDVASSLVQRALAALPFELTGDQRRAWGEIARDLGRPHPMNRLLLGDVGTGKTVLAVLASVASRASGGLSAVLAPTELLARQHFATFTRLLDPLGMRTALLTGGTRGAERQSLARLLRLGEIHVVIGTHALISEHVELPELRLVVIDEQHRFGVAQRGVLPRKGDHPHVLAMSATPIPRTLALTVFGDVEQSQLRERPPGRAPVATQVVPPSAARAVLAELVATIERGEQIYVVYPLVEESEKQDLIDATRGYERLRAALPQARVALLHGRLEPGERVRVMESFVAGKVDVLVATTVIEVGVDVPNATLLVVRHAERFGLAQLHQLRGRVGRGGRPGRALLVADPVGGDAARRLAILETTSCGFEIAEEDLRIRGAGEWLGTRQAGHLPELRLADLVAHEPLLPPLREAAARLLEVDRELGQHAALRGAVQRRWGRRLEFAGTA